MKTALQPCETHRRFGSIIGKTPLILLTVTLDGRPLRIAAKAEFLNFTGSIKDRMALSILTSARACGALMPGQPIVEVTSGNAGIALAALGTALGHPVTIYMPDWMSIERQALLRSFGATLRLVSRDEGGFIGALSLSVEHARRTCAFQSLQFDNPDNVSAHRHGTATELLAQLTMKDRTLDAFVAGVGTGGTVMGIAMALTDARVSARVHPVEPAESPTLSTGHKIGAHRIQGISDDFIPSILKLEQLDPPICVSDSCAIRMAQRLSRELGLGVGISSGANLLAALSVAAGLDEGATVATVFCDNSLRYLSGPLGQNEPPRAGSLVDRIESIGIEAIVRAG